MSAEEVLSAAKNYIERGWVVHPLSKSTDQGKSPGKKPLLENWQDLKQTPDDIGADIKDGCNIGLVCGKVSNVDAFDIDLPYFVDDLFKDVKIDTLTSGHRDGRGHLLFKHENDLIADKKHFIGIEYFGTNKNGGGTNLVLPPSVHVSGEVYKWKNPDIPIATMPDRLKMNWKELIRKEDALKDIFKKCRPCFFKTLWDNPDDVAVHNKNGRDAVLSIMGELKANGCTNELLHVACKRFFGKDYKYEETEKELQYIQPIHPKCETLRANLRVDCANCKHKQEETSPRPELLDVGELPETIQLQTKQASLNLTGLRWDNYLIKHVNYATKMTDSYVDYHVGNGLVNLAIAANRKIKVCFAHETIYPNIWTFLIGDSTVARKTASVNIGFDKIAIPVFGTSGFLPQSASPESLIEELSNQPNSSLIRDEAGGFMRELDKNYMQGMKDTLCTLYDNRDFHRKIRTGQRKGAQTDFNIKNPFINLLFATTPETFKNYSTLLDLTSGWLVRFLYFTPDHEKEWRGYRKETIEDITIRDDVRRCLELIKLRVDSWQDEKEFILTDEAMQFFTEWQKRTEMEAVKNKDKNKLRILGRLHTYAVKIAMLFTLGDNTDNTEISKTYIEIACRLIEDYFIITACALLEDISRDEKHNVQDRIIGILRTYGKVNIRDLLRYTHRPKKEIAEALEALDDRGSFEIKRTKSESGKTIYYELNGFKTKNATVTSVTGVASVASVPTVPEIQGINATVVTDDIHSRDAQANLGRYSCDKSDKCDSCDSSDTSDTKTVTELSKPSFRDFGVRAKDWICYNSKAITKETLTEASMWIAASVKANPSDVKAYLIREYAIAIEQGGV